MSPPANTYGGLLVSFAGVLREIDSLTRCASKYLTSESTTTVLKQWKSDLESFRDSTTLTTKWQIPAATPIQTVGSTSYDRQSGRTVFATLSCAWELQKVKDPSDKRKHRISNKAFLLKGQAKTEVCLYEKTDMSDDPLGRWSFEVGDGDQGTHFHTQIKVEDVPPFPHWLPVPRLPTMMITPMDALEYVLSELFQHEWAQHLGGRSAEVGVWDSEQKERLRNLLEWHVGCVNKSGSTAWNRIKRECPPRTLLGVTA